MSRDYRVYLDDIVAAIDKIAEFTKGMSQEQFLEDLKTFDAVIRNLEIVGEAVKKIPKEVRCQYAEIEWRKVASLRDLLIHEYFAVDTDIIWDVVMNKLPSLRQDVRKILAQSALGMWKDREDLRDVDQAVRNLRKGRHDAL